MRFTLLPQEELLAYLTEHQPRTPKQAAHLQMEETAWQVLAAECADIFRYAGTFSAAGAPALEARSAGAVRAYATVTLLSLREPHLTTADWLEELRRLHMLMCRAIVLCRADADAFVAHDTPSFQPPPFRFYQVGLITRATADATIAQQLLHVSCAAATAILAQPTEAG